MARRLCKANAPHFISNQNQACPARESRGFLRRFFCPRLIAALIASVTFGETPGAPPAERAAGSPHPATLRVGVGEEFFAPSVAAKFAKSGDTIEIAAGTYSGDVAVWKQNDLTIRGVGGIVRLVADGAAAEGKAIWVMKGNNTFVENVEFSGARVRDRNGAGIRLEGGGLTVRNSRFDHNENGILCGSNPEADVVVEHSEFAHNGHGDGQSHNIYCGRIRSLTLRFNYIHHAVVGHNVKSRAARNLILYNRIGDESAGNSSYAIDLPNGGFSVLLGNVVQKGPLAENRTLIAYGAEGYKSPSNALYVVNNTLVNEQREPGRFVFVRDGPAEVTVINNLHFGPGSLLSGRGETTNNRAATVTDFRDAKAWDFRLNPRSRAIGAGVDPGMADGIPLKPTQQYAHKARAAQRSNLRGIDLGAFGAD